MLKSVKYIVFLVAFLFLFGSCNFVSDNTRGNNRIHNNGSGTSNSGTGANNDTGDESGTNNSGAAPSEDPAEPPVQAGPETITLSFDDLEQTPNEGGYYYRILPNTTEVTITGLSNKDVKLVRMNTSNSALTDVNPVTLLSGNTNVSGRMVSSTEYVPVEEKRNSFEYSNCNDNGPYNIPFVDNIDYDNLTQRIGSSGFESSRIVSTSSVTYEEGDTKDFRVRIDDAWTSISATLIAEGDYCYVWVADENLNTSAETNYNSITVYEASLIAYSFDDIYEKEVGLIGNSYSRNKFSQAYINPQRKISIFVYDIDGDYETTIDTLAGTYGFFWAKDLYLRSFAAFFDENDPSEASAKTIVENSNEMEIFYLDALFTNLDYVGLLSIICHEFEHMLYYVNKTLKQSITGSETWFSEMGAMMTEDLFASYLNETYGEFDISIDSPLYRLRKFKSEYYKGGVVFWDDNSMDGSLLSYATSGIFGLWLQRNYGGERLIKQIANNYASNIASITKAIETCGGTDKFVNAFRKYALSFAQPSATKFTLNKSTTGNEEGLFALAAADVWSSNYPRSGSNNETLTYSDPYFVPANYTGTMQSYGFWITGWQSESCSTVKLVLSEPSTEENYIVITDHVGGSNGN